MMKRRIASILFSAIALLVLVTAGCGGGGEGPSTPTVKPLDEYKNMQALIGDPHFHTVISDGDESPDFALRYARDVENLDWCCVTDHAEYMIDDNLVGLPYYRTLVSKYDAPGSFCVLYGWEWTSNYFGHRDIYSLDNTVPIFSSRDPLTNTPEELWAALQGYDVITVPHHPMIMSTDLWWQHTNPVEGSVEFYSKWGMSFDDGDYRPLKEPRTNNAVMAALIYGGLRMGFMAGTDSHMSRPGSSMGESRQVPGLEYSQPGLTGVWVPTFTREALFQAIRDRHTYGLTGTRVDLMFSVNNNIMGSIIRADASPQLAYRVDSPVVITKIELIKFYSTGQNTLQIHTPNTRVYQGTYTDSGYSGSVAYTMRVTLENGDLAIASPVWVDPVPPGGNPASP